MAFVLCPHPFDVPYIGFEVIILEDQFADEELIFISHILADDDSSNPINQSSSNLDISLVDPQLIN